MSPDLPSPPAPGADAHGPLDDHRAGSHRVIALEDVRVAEVPAAQRALEHGVGTASLEPAEPDLVSLSNLLAVFQVANQVLLLGPAVRTTADLFVLVEVVRVGVAERAPTVLAAVGSRV